jgi:flagellar basal-body rod protein FlgB
MVESMFDRGSLPAIERWLHYTVARHRAIANNIANVETPFYKTQDVPTEPFEKTMIRAFEDQARSRTGRFAIGPADFRTVEADLENSGILRHSENNVDIDVEMAKMIQNGGLHNLLANLLTQQFDLLRESISEKVR